MAQIRRHIVTEPRYQWRFALAFFRGSLVAIALPALFSFAAVWVAGRAAHLAPPQFDIVARAVRHAAVLWAVGAIAAGILSTMIGLRLSQRYAGPLKRIEAWVARRLLDDPRDEISVRPGDELGLMAESLSRIAQMRRP